MDHRTWPSPRFLHFCAFLNVICGETKMKCFSFFQFSIFHSPAPLKACAFQAVQQTKQNLLIDFVLRTCIWQQASCRLCYAIHVYACLCATNRFATLLWMQRMSVCNLWCLILLLLLLAYCIRLLAVRLNLAWFDLAGRTLDVVVPLVIGNFRTFMLI